MREKKTHTEGLEGIFYRDFGDFLQALITHELLASDPDDDPLCIQSQQMIPKRCYFSFHGVHCSCLTKKASIVVH